MFNYSECLNDNFKTEVSHKVSPFGLTKNIINVEKDKCVIVVKHQRYKYLKNKWVIDVCRAPVHIKEGSDAVNVIKRADDCSQKYSSSSDYCNTFSTISKYIQDDGLIFAKGDKEDLESNHGKMYCSFLLMQKYLSTGSVLSRSKDDTFSSEIKNIELAHQQAVRRPLQRLAPARAQQFQAQTEAQQFQAPAEAQQFESNPQQVEQGTMQPKLSQLIDSSKNAENVPKVPQNETIEEF